LVGTNPADLINEAGLLLEKETLDGDELRALIEAA